MGAKTMATDHEGGEAIAEAKRAWQRLQDEAAADPHPDRDPAVVVLRLIATGGMLLAVIVLAGVIGSIAPIGLGGAMLALIALVVVGAGGIAWALKRPDAPDAKDMASVPVADLSKDAIAWIGTRTRALPAPSRTILSSISERLRTLEPLVARLDPQGPEAAEVRGLLAEQLPSLVADFERVPSSLRTVDRNGRTPEQTLQQGLSVIESETAEILERLAQADLDGLQTRGRYLDLKYGDPA
jgi:hypothetical protein